MQMFEQWYHSETVQSFLYGLCFYEEEKVTDFLCSYQCHIIPLCVMQSSVTQTITSTEDNYRANVNFTGGGGKYSKCRSEPKISNIPKIKKHTRHESQFIDTEEELKWSYKHSLQR